LDEVPWGELECAYGPATKIPQMLRGLAAGDPDVLDAMVAATALGHCDPPAVQAGAVLEAHRRTELDLAVRATLIAGAAACDPAGARGWGQDASRDPAANARAAAGYATAVNALPWMPLTTETLLSCWDDGDPLPASWQWQWDLNWWLDSALGRLTRDDRDEHQQFHVHGRLPA
jgi:hypothetical protein